MTDPIKESIYWNWDKKCPQIFIDAVCKNEGLPDAKAGYGLNTGSDVQNRHTGPVLGLQTARRAHIYSISKSLQWIYHSNQKLNGKYPLVSANQLPCVLPAIRDRIVVVSKENVVWKQVRGDRAAGDEDLWTEVDMWLERLEAIRIEVFFEGIDQYFGIPTALANRSAGNTYFLPKSEDVTDSEDFQIQNPEIAESILILLKFLKQFDGHEALKLDSVQDFLNTANVFIFLNRNGLLNHQNLPENLSADSAENGSNNTKKEEEPTKTGAAGASSSPVKRRFIPPHLRNGSEHSLDQTRGSYVPPHLRNRSEHSLCQTSGSYVPPHLRNKSQNAASGASSSNSGQGYQPRGNVASGASGYSGQGNQARGSSEDSSSNSGQAYQPRGNAASGASPMNPANFQQYRQPESDSDSEDIPNFQHLNLHDPDDYDDIQIFPDPLYRNYGSDNDDNDDYDWGFGDSDVGEYVENGDEWFCDSD